VTISPSSIRVSHVCSLYFCLVFPVNLYFS
jgi:hypothetical protein